MPSSETLVVGFDPRNMCPTYNPTIWAPFRFQGEQSPVLTFEDGSGSGSIERPPLPADIPTEEDGSTLSHKPATYTALSLLRLPNMRRKTVLLALCFIANMIMYVGIAFNSGNLGGNFLISFALQVSTSSAWFALCWCGD